MLDLFSDVSDWHWASWFALFMSSDSLSSAAPVISALSYQNAIHICTLSTQYVMVAGD